MTLGKQLRYVLGLLGVIALTSAVPALAHHSFAVFDHSRTVTVKGTVTKFQWTNPHAFLELDVPDDKGWDDERAVSDGDSPEQGSGHNHPGGL